MAANAPKSSTSGRASSHRRVISKGRDADIGGTLQDTIQLARLLAHDQVEAVELRRALVKVADQLEQERNRTTNAEARARTAEANVVELQAAKQILFAELQRDRETLKNYQIQVEVARKEITHAQEEINRLAAEKYRADEDAARERSKSRQIQKDFEINLALEKGRKQGYLNGRDDGWREATYIGGDRRVDEYDDEGDEGDVERDSPLSPRYSASGQRRRMDYPESTRPLTNANTPGGPNDYIERNLPQLPEQQSSRRRYGELGRSNMSPIQENASVRSHVGSAAQMQSINPPTSVLNGANGLELSMQMPMPQTAPSYTAPPARSPSVRAASVRAASVQGSPVRSPSVHSPPARAASVEHSLRHQTMPNSFPLPDNQIFRQPTPQQSPFMSLMEENGNRALPRTDPQRLTPITPEAFLPSGRGGLSPRAPSLVIQAPTPPEASMQYPGTPRDVQDQPEIGLVSEYLSPRQGSVRSLGPQP